MFKIDSRIISEESPPFIIAELSANHGGSIERAKQSILAAKSSGASAVKLQTYTPDTMTIDCDKEDFKINEGLWKGYTLYDLYKEAFTPFEWHGELFEFAKRNGIIIFSSPFDETAVDLLEELDAPAYKIASFELIDIPLIDYVAKKGKPILMSTGMSSIEEIGEAVETVRSAGNEDILLFHCISSYPAPTEDSNLKNLLYLSKHFKTLVGLSDHSTNSIAAIASISLGACAIEKHFKLDNVDCGPDASFSLLPTDLKELVDVTNEAWKALGSSDFSRAAIEEDNKIFRRSLYFTNDLKRGSKISKNDIRRIRPGYGLPPKYLEDVISKTIKEDVSIGDPVTWEILD